MEKQYLKSYFHFAVPFWALFFALDFAIGRWIPQRYATYAGIFLIGAFLLAMVVVPLLLYRRGRRTEEFFPRVMHRPAVEQDVPAT